MLKKKCLGTLPLFASISMIAYEKCTQKFYLIIEHLKTIEYSSYLTGYILEDIQDSMIKTISIDSLVHHAPLDCYNIKNKNHLNIKIVIPKYEI